MIWACELTKNFGAFSAVAGISFEVAKGEIFAFLGPNGAGKTTTIKMLTTLLKPSSGSVALDGLNPVTQQQEARKRFGIVFQDSSTDDELTACENMDFHGVLYSIPKRIRAERIVARPYRPVAAFGSKEKRAGLEQSLAASDGLLCQ